MFEQPHLKITQVWVTGNFYQTEFRSQNTEKVFRMTGGASQRKAFSFRDTNANGMALQASPLKDSLEASLSSVKIADSC